MRNTCLAFVLLLAIPATADEVAPSKPNNRFQFELYQRLAARDGNLFFSGYSIRTALAMTYAGARGDTAAQLETVLHLGPTAHRQAREVTDVLAKKRGFEVSVANALWGQAGHPFTPDYLELCKASYGAPLHSVDFRETEAARKTINDWVENRTRERIRELIPQGFLNADSRLVLTNAIYFKAAWATPFRESLTRPRPFHLTPEKTVDVPMMLHTGNFRFAEGEGGLKMVEIYYRGGASMIVVVADDIAKVDLAKLGPMYGALRGQQLVLSMPRFKVETQFDAAPTLRAMGMPLPLSPNADFSGITGKRDLFISNVIHKAFVEVDEHGTEAAAATAAVMKGGSRIVPGQPRVIRIDRPFLFWIRERQTGCILFMGRVTDPRGR